MGYHLGVLNLGKMMTKQKTDVFCGSPSPEVHKKSPAECRDAVGPWGIRCSKTLNLPTAFLEILVIQFFGAENNMLQQSLKAVLKKL